MADDQLRSRGIKDPRVLKAMETVPRHLFVPESVRSLAYEDKPLDIGQGQTISQPYMVAAMTELIDPRHGDRILEIGTGSGYQAAVLSGLAGHVYTIEIIDELAHAAEKRLNDLGYFNVSVKSGDGYYGWEEHAPFDAVIVTAAPEEIPQPLIDQLKVGGRLVIPVGAQHQNQDLKLLLKEPDGTLAIKSVMPVRFVPFTRD